MRLVIWHGSGLNDPYALKRQVAKVARYIGVDPPVVGQTVRRSTVVRGSCAETAQDFLTLMRGHEQFIVCADGGTGASRVIRHLFDVLPAQTTAFRASENVVIGHSDSSVYVAAAHLFFGASGFYGRNLLEPFDDVINAFQEAYGTLDRPTSHTHNFTGVKQAGPALAEESYVLFPVCLRPFTSVSGRFQLAALRYLSANRCLFMVEDAYPQGDLNWIGFYEDLTRLMPYLEAVGEGGGAVAFGPVPGSDKTPGGEWYGPRIDEHTLVTEALECAGVNIPAFSGVRFGHYVDAGSKNLVAFGLKAEVKFKDGVLTVSGQEG